MNRRLQDVRNEHDYVGTPYPGLTYVLVAKREQFDLISLPLTDHGENDQGHVLSKAMDKDGIYIVFQHWLKERTIEAIREDNEKRRAAEAEKVDA